MSFTCLSSMLIFATPSSSTSMLPEFMESIGVESSKSRRQENGEKDMLLPRSPTMRSSSSGDP
jgi:hypothetical protein